jgi:hypothetical protein
MVHARQCQLLARRSALCSQPVGMGPLRANQLERRHIASLGTEAKRKRKMSSTHGGAIAPLACVVGRRQSCLERRDGQQPIGGCFTGAKPAKVASREAW